MTRRARTSVRHNKNDVERRRKKRTSDDDKLKERIPQGLAQSFVKSKLHDKALSLAGLGPPKDWEGEMPELPNELADLDHDELSDLLAQFTNAHSTALWNASKWYVESGTYDEIADYLENIELTDPEGSNDAQRKANARTAEPVMLARSLRLTAYNNYVRFRDDAKTLENRAKAVSRIGGFVGDEAESEELSAGKRSTRGKSAGRSRGKDRGTGRARARR